MIKLWIEALRSGKYKQGFDRLMNTDGSCCALGVACLVYEEHVKPLAREVSGIGICLDGKKFVLPEHVRVWLYGDNDNEIKVNVSYLNDVLKLTFAEIADILEETYDT